MMPCDVKMIASYQTKVNDVKMMVSLQKMIELYQKMMASLCFEYGGGVGGTGGVGAR